MEVDGFSQPLMLFCIGSSPTGTGTAIASKQQQQHVQQRQ
jgi:hypothetical protein